MIRYKFKCSSITESEWGFQYQMTPVFGGEENKVYWEATPSGSFQVSIAKSKGKVFEVGKEYFLDISGAS